MDESASRPVAQESGKVTYTVTMINGDKEVPANSQLGVTTSIGVDILNKTCATKIPEGTAGEITLDAPDLPSLPAGMVITCSFQVTVTNDHKLKGQIDPITVSAQLSGTNILNDAPFHILNATSQPVPVYTGGSLSSVGVNAAPAENKFYTGKRP